MSTFLEIVFRSADFNFGGRDEVEDPLDETLQELGLGEVTGGGTGTDTCNIDVEVADLNTALPVIRRVLTTLNVSQSTVINQYKPQRVMHLVYLSPTK